MALFDSQYSLDQAYNNPVVQQPLASPTPLSPFNSGGDPSFGKTLMGQSALDDSYLRYQQQQQFPEQQLGQYQSSLFGNPLNQQPSYTQTDGAPGLGKTLGGLSSLMSPQLQPGITSPFKKGDEELNQRPEGFISPMGGYAPSAFDPLGVGGRDQEILGDIRDPIPQPTMPTPTPMPPPGLDPLAGAPTTEMYERWSPEQRADWDRYGEFGDPSRNPLIEFPTPTPMPTATLPPPAQPTMPTATPMPGDVGYVPYGSRNNQLVPPGYEKPSFVQGLAGGGPVGNLSFVELLRQTMEN